MQAAQKLGIVYIGKAGGKVCVGGYKWPLRLIIIRYFVKESRFERCWRPCLGCLSRRPFLKTDQLRTNL